MKRIVTTFAVIAALALNAPLLMADHEDKGNKHHQGNKHGDDDQGWEHRGGYEYRTYVGDSRPPGWSQGKKPDGEIAECHQAKQKSMAAAITPTRITLTITIKTTKGKSSSGVQRLRCMAAWTSSISQSRHGRTADV